MDELGVIGDESEDFIQFISVSFSPDKSKMAFAVSSKEIALATFSINGILNLETNEVNVIPNILNGDVEKFIWSPMGEHFAYTVGTARAEWDMLGVDDVLNKKNNFVVDGRKIGSILGETDPIHFIPQFRNLKWSFDGKKLYFRNNDKGSKGEVGWVINVDGTELKRAIEETANWKTYKNEEIGIEFKYPDNYKIDVTGGHMPYRPELGVRISVMPKGIIPDINNPYIDINLIDSTYFASLEDYISKTYETRISPIDELSVGKTISKIYKLENADFFYIFLRNKGSIFNISSQSKDFLVKVLSTFRFLE